ncbi:MAG: pilin [Candidatus Uhrbacteria bacterium]
MHSKGSLFGIITLLVFVAGFAVASPVLAQGTAEGLNAVGNAAGIASGTTDLYTIIGRIINIALGFVGIVLLGLFLYAGYEWMTSGGDPKKVESAKMRLRNAVIGLILIASSFAIVNFILGALLDATSGGGGLFGSGPTGGVGSGFPSSSGSLGGGIIEMHVPPRDAMDVPRNTGIVVTFKEPIKISSFISGYDDHGTPADLTDDAGSSTTVGINSNAVKVYVTGHRNEALTTAQARVRFTADRKTFVIKPVDYLGSPTENTNYTVEFVGGQIAGSSVLLEDGSAAFGGAFSSGYRWSFEVSTVVDLTPPHVTTVIPQAGRSFAPNIIVQVDFNEAIDPTSAAGIWRSDSGFGNITLSATPASGPVGRPNGEFRISNQYRTVEFVSDLACGTNSCGRTIYCLPSDSSIAVNVLSPSAGTPPQADLTASGYDGVVDMAGNALDTNNDGSINADDDRYGWTFGTTGAPNLTAPKIKSTSPIAGNLGDSSNLVVDRKPNATFDSILQSSTVNSENIIMRTNEPLASADTFWWSVSQEMLNAAGTIAEIGDEPVAGLVPMSHRIFISATSTAFTPVYQSLYKSGLQNVYQNCFNPAASETCAANSTNPNCCDNRPGRLGCTAPSRTP